MGTTYSPSVVTNGLVMYHDMSNTQKSWRGAPVTNLLPTPTINSVPTTGNGWGTYNTNQYNSSAYFSIGSISSVSSNIVTTSGSHPLRSYDVVTPQSSGGGVTAGTNYLVKKLSATQFSLHTWNSSQDGSQGYINPATGTHKVYDDFANDVRISINSSSFPTQWWGYPHLPNSGLVKEVRTNGCSIPGIPTTDCLRLYHTRPDGVTDGMAYGVDAPVTAGVAHTVSFWTKTVNPSAVGQSISYQIYNYGASATGFSFSATLGAVGVWVKQSMTFTPVYATCISYFFPSSGNIIYDLAHIQFETGSVANAWTNSSRSTTQSLLDLTGKNTLSITGLPTYNDNSITFPNINSAWIETTDATKLRMGTQNFTISCWVKQLDNGTNCLLESRSSSNLAGYFFILNYPLTGQISVFLNYGGSQYVYSSSISSLGYGTVQNIAAVISRVTTSILLYVNGNLWNTITGIHTNSISPTAGDLYRIGFDQGGGTANYELYSYAHYSRGLSATEIQQNFNALRSRYGI